MMFYWKTNTACIGFLGFFGFYTFGLNPEHEYSCCKCSNSSTYSPNSCGAGCSGLDTNEDCCNECLCNESFCDKCDCNGCDCNGCDCNGCDCGGCDCGICSLCEIFSACP